MLPIVATVDADGLPEATRGWAVDVLPGGRELRLLPRRRTRGRTLAKSTTTGAIALTATHFATLSSVQMKGRVVSVEPRTAGRPRPLRRVLRRVRARRSPRSTVRREELVWRMRPLDVVACVVTVEEVYDQTPGPGGRRASSPRRGVSAWRRDVPPDNSPDAARHPVVLRGHHPGRDRDRVGRRCTQRHAPLARAHGRRRARRAVEPVLLEDDAQPRREPDGRASSSTRSVTTATGCACAYERTERRGPLFEQLRRDIDAIAALTGMQDVFKLRSADVYRVVGTRPDARGGAPDR